jgi:hypothetical protein
MAGNKKNPAIIGSPITSEPEGAIQGINVGEENFGGRSARYDGRSLEDTVVTVAGKNGYII